jgi:hypothetical protein
MKSLLVPFLLLPSTILSSCGSLEGNVQRADTGRAACPTLAIYDPAAAPSHATAAFARGERRLMGVYGYTGIVPAAEHVNLPVTYIQGTSDAIGSAECGRLNGLAHQYAEKFNRQMLAAIGDPPPRK